MHPERGSCTPPASPSASGAVALHKSGAVAAVQHQHFCKLFSPALLLRVRSPPCALNALQSAVPLFLPHPIPPPPPPPTTTTTTTPVLQ